MKYTVGMTIWLAVLFTIYLLPVWGIIDAALRPDDAWAAVGQKKVVWIPVQIFLWTLGAAAYFIAVRPKLRGVTRAR